MVKSKLTQEHKDLLKQDSIKWDDLVKQGILEYLDTAEEENAFSCISKRRYYRRTYSS